MSQRHENRKDLIGEHPIGDIGQTILLIVFLALWALDSFVFRFSTFLAAYIPLIIRLVLAGLILPVGLYLATKSMLRKGTRPKSSKKKSILTYDTPCTWL